MVQQLHPAHAALMALLLLAGIAGAQETPKSLMHAMQPSTAKPGLHLETLLDADIGASTVSSWGRWEPSLTRCWLLVSCDPPTSVQVTLRGGLRSQLTTEGQPTGTDLASKALTFEARRKAFPLGQWLADGGFDQSRHVFQFRVVPESACRVRVQVVTWREI